VVKRERLKIARPRFEKAGEDPPDPFALLIGEPHDSKGNRDV
jgi:hypothetical protein